MSVRISVTVLFSVVIMMMMVLAVDAMPIFLVTSGRGKCMSLTEPEGTLLNIQYEAPDLVLTKKEEGGGPVWITANTVSMEPVSASSFGTSKTKNDRNQQPLSHELRKRQGQITYLVPIDGQVNICIRASAASTKYPMRFGFVVERETEELEPDEPPDAKDKTNAHHHSLSKVEDETNKLRQIMNQILAEADFAKEREKTFHAQSQHMNAASMWWPIVQIGFLLCMGFTQASHITGFFKSRHII